MQPGSGGGGSPDPYTMAAQAFNTFGKGIATARAASFNEAIDAQNATLANQQGASEMAASDASYRGAEGRQLAAEGASGLDMGTGSMLDAIAQSRVAQTFSAMQISRTAQLRAMGFQEQADMQKFTARNAILTGSTDAISGMMNTTMDYANQWNASGYGGSTGAGAGGALQPSYNGLDAGIANG